MTNPAASPDASLGTSHRRYFFEKFGITERLLERCLGEALAAGGDYADLYFESVTSTALGVDEQIVKSASQGASAGCGIRVLSGERTGYAYTDNLSPEQAAARGAHGGTYRFRSGETDRAGVHRDARRRSLSRAARRIRSGPGRAPRADRASRSRCPGVRSAHCAGAGKL